MFERAHENRISVIVTMTDGETMQGSLRLPLSNKLADAINNPESFLDFAMPDGERCFLAKHSVRRVEPFNVPRVDQLERHGKSDQGFDPCQILGLPKDPNAVAIKQAYHRLARSYHPDRFAGLELPREMHDYATAMLARINLAYKQLQGAERSRIQH
jgi:hypothetical protein